jgi:hypothetical protein
LGERKDGLSVLLSISCIIVRITITQILEAHWLFGTDYSARGNRRRFVEPSSHLALSNKTFQMGVISGSILINPVEGGSELASYREFQRLQVAEVYD